MKHEAKACKVETMKFKLLRGATGIALIVAAFFLMPEHYALAFLCFALSFVPFRGCIVCWTVEMHDALRAKKGKPL